VDISDSNLQKIGCVIVVEKKWYEKKIIEPMNEFANLRIIKSISGGIASGVNVLLIGSFLFYQ